MALHQNGNPEMEIVSIPAAKGEGSSSREHLRFPLPTMYIVANEFCERFSFYGMRTILALYVANELGFGDVSATEIVSLFTAAAYFTPLLGGYISDSLIGKYSTILYLCILYCVGNWTLTYSAVKAESVPSSNGTATSYAFLGLFLIALGTGGIKPCVSAFGGDQITGNFPPGAARERLLTSFFSAFYFAINAGAGLSTFFTPWIRTSVSYSAAFALPAVLMMISVLIFWSGRNQYIHRPPRESLFFNVVKIIAEGLFPKSAQLSGIETVGAGFEHNSNGKMGSEEKKNEMESEGSMKGPSRLFGAIEEDKIGEEHDKKEKDREDKVVLGTEDYRWLDRAKGKYHWEDVEDVKKLLRVITLFIPASIFWCLYDQQATVWVFQAEEMDGTFGDWVIEPDQMQTINAVGILLFIPLFNGCIYPSLERTIFSLYPLRRIIVGMFLCALSFVMAGILQCAIDRSTASTTTLGNISLVTSDVATVQRISMLWQVPQYVVITAAEILFSITGLELAYSLAPPAMSSIVTSFWLLTDTGGNLITIFLVAIMSENLGEAVQAFVFAGLGFVGWVIFLWIGFKIPFERERRVDLGGSAET